ncbi:hypothetical protein BACCAP_01219 [Pseudoflavonifractor capillosus ATCC 29799]|uniref:Uncharacterized protein n=1 Tax=Pseudoflavonifractor capillosus ATCC 29799 TaxID=411467 RepID=A6NSP0_9FIRM|nr:hypothetical protein BACCAP_01219 [Pseudoflavonifractor capillosus ATCC 29799]
MIAKIELYERCLFNPGPVVPNRFCILIIAPSNDKIK